MSSMLSALSQWFVNPHRNPLARLHMLSVSSRLRKYGLRYDDLYDPYHDLDIKEALARLPTEVVDARIQRLKRSLDLSMKHQYLPEDLQLPKKLVDIDGGFDVWTIQVANENVDGYSITLVAQIVAGVLVDKCQALQTPFKSYLSDMLALVKKEAAEREALGALPLYQRTLP